MPTRIETVQHLMRELRRREGAQRPATSTDSPRSTGIPGVDALLPDGGLCTGTLVEWLATETASGMGSLVFRIAAQLRCELEVCVVIDQGRVVYPPAVCRLGADLDTTIVVHPARVQDALWTWEQSLRCGGVAVVIGWLSCLREREFRRLQLAAEAGGGIGMLLRSARDRQQPSWADLRLLVEPQPPGALNSSRIVRERPPPRSRRLRVDLLHSRGHFRTGTVLLDIDDETGAVHQVPRLAPAANPRRAAGA